MEHRLQRREWKRGSRLKHPTHHSQEPAETSLPKAPDIWNESSCWALLDPYLSEATPVYLEEAHLIEEDVIAL